ncbi:patatin-like phospholipase family protein [Acidithiobacillus ferrianus]|uniref:PNPLA domain-containing protein n=2 Tax=Acidithiobacillus ferrianus TaxID=2678518 RepID=A0A845U804_9PROT|nr:patatin-like phospholipase family protein [Acidithiobacillus ferrianus]NDU41887.1 hypothetical protein [Acidithiobacillus ferrianus]
MPTDFAKQQPGITLVLGSGGARGLAHVGVLRALEELKIPIRAIVGCSIGAEIGAFYCTGMPTATLEAEACATRWWGTLRLFFPDFGGGGLSRGVAITQYLYDRLGDRQIEDFPLPFACVATDMVTGQEVILSSGPALPAVRASIALPVMLAPQRHGGRILADGGLIDPVPIAVARALFPGPLVAVLVHRTQREGAWSPPPAPRTGGDEPTEDIADTVIPDLNILQALRRSVEIMQSHLVNLQMRFASADLILAPKLENIQTLGFHKGEVAVMAGYQATHEAAADLGALLQQST